MNDSPPIHQTIVLQGDSFSAESLVKLFKEAEALGIKAPPMQIKINRDNILLREAVKERDEARARIRGLEIINKGLRQQIAYMRQQFKKHGVKEDDEKRPPEMAELPQEPTT